MSIADPIVPTTEPMPRTRNISDRTVRCAMSSSVGPITNLEMPCIRDRIADYDKYILQDKYYNIPIQQRTHSSKS